MLLRSPGKQQSPGTGASGALHVRSLRLHHAARGHGQIVRYRQRRAQRPSPLEPGAEPKALKQPYAIRMADGNPFAFAGLWENWKAPEGHWLRTCTIITTAANELVARLHDRMPVILAPEDYGRWLGEEPPDPGEVLDLLRPYHAVTAYPVSKAVCSCRRSGCTWMETRKRLLPSMALRFPLDLFCWAVARQPNCHFLMRRCPLHPRTRWAGFHGKQRRRPRGQGAEYPRQQNEAACRTAGKGEYYA